MRFVMLPGDEQEKSAGHVVEHFLCLGSKAIAEEKPRTGRRIRVAERKRSMQGMCAGAVLLSGVPVTSQAVDSHGRVSS